MAETRDAIAARLRADPEYAVLTRTVNGETHTLSADEREARITDMADAIQQSQLDAEVLTALKDTRRQVRLARTRLQQIRDASGAFTNAQRDAATKDLARYLDGLIGVLIDLALIERSD